MTLSNIPDVQKAHGLLSRWEWFGLFLFVLAVLLYFTRLIVVDAHGLQDHECTRLIHAGQAVHADKSIYGKGEHAFSGPPILAMMAASLVYLPAEFCLALCYLINLLCITLSCHWIASTLEPGVPAGCRRWWYLRTIPLALLVAALGTHMTSDIGHALALLMISRLLFALGSRQSFGAGVWLAGAITMHLSSFVLVLIPICRRDRMMTMGTVLGLLLGMLLVPGMAFGLQRTNRLNAEYLQVVKQRLPADISLIAADAALGILIIVASSRMDWRRGPLPLCLLHLIATIMAMLSSWQPDGIPACYLLPALVGMFADEDGGSIWTTAAVLTGVICCSLPSQVLALPLVGTFIMAAMSLVMLAGHSRLVQSAAKTKETKRQPQVDLPRAA